MSRLDKTFRWVVSLWSAVIVMVDSMVKIPLLQPLVTMIRTMVEEFDEERRQRARPILHLPPTRLTMPPLAETSLAPPSYSPLSVVPMEIPDFDLLGDLPTPVLSPSTSICSSISSASSSQVDLLLPVRRMSMSSVSRVESIVRRFETGRVSKSGSLPSRRYSLSEVITPVLRRRGMEVKPAIGVWEKRIAQARSHERIRSPSSATLSSRRQFKAMMPPSPTPSKSVPVDRMMYEPLETLCPPSPRF